MIVSWNYDFHNLVQLARKCRWASSSWRTQRYWFQLCTLWHPRISGISTVGSKSISYPCPPAIWNVQRMAILVLLVTSRKGHSFGSQIGQPLPQPVRNQHLWWALKNFCAREMGTRRVSWKCAVVPSCASVTKHLANCNDKDLWFSRCFVANNPQAFRNLPQVCLEPLTMEQAPSNAQSMECRTFGMITEELWAPNSMAIQLQFLLKPAIVERQRIEARERGSWIVDWLLMVATASKTYRQKYTEVDFIACSENIQKINQKPVADCFYKHRMCLCVSSQAIPTSSWRMSGSVAPCLPKIRPTCQPGGGREALPM